MRIWKLDSDVDNYAYLIPEKDQDQEKVNFCGEKLGNNWIPVRFKFGGEIQLGDCPDLNASAPVFSEKAVEILKDLIEDSVEILPLQTKIGSYYAINVIDILDCIDYSNSKFVKFKSSNRIMVFEKYAFHLGCVQERNIFKIIDEPGKRAFVSDTFRERVLNSGLKGFQFTLVWDSVEGPTEINMKLW